MPPRGPLGPPPKAPRPPRTSVTTGNNPRGVAIKPPRAPRVTGPKPSTHTGANPRGVAIRPPVRSAGTTANARAAKRAVIAKAVRGTPRGTAIAPRGPLTVNDRAAIRQAAHAARAAHRGGGGLLGTIEGLPIVSSIAGDAGNVASTIGRTAKNFGNEFIHLPVTTVDALEQLGIAAAHDVIHGQIPGAGLLASSEGAPDTGATSHLVKSAVSNDPIVQAVKTGSFTPIENQPLNAALDVSGIYGAAGDAAGALARAGALGSAAKDAAQLGRPAEEIVPGLGAAASRTRGNSPNLFTTLARRTAEKAGVKAPQRLQAAHIGSVLRKNIAKFHAAEQGERDQLRLKIIKDFRKAKPGKVEANVAPHVIAFGARDIPNMLREILAQREREGATLTGATRKTAELDTKHIRAALAKADKGTLDEAALRHFAETYHGNQMDLEKLQAELQMREPSEMAHATRNQYMLQHDNVVYLERGAKNPALHQAVKDARQAVSEARAERKAAETQRDVTLGLHKGASKELANTTRRLPLVPANDSFLNDLLDSRRIHEVSQPFYKAQHDEAVKTLKVAERDAQKRLTLAQKAYKSPANKLKGAMIHDDNAPALEEGLLKGMRMRPLTDADFAEAAKGEPAPVSYVAHKNPLRRKSPTIGEVLRDHQAPLAEVGRKPYTGEAIRVGDIHPGYGAAVRSQLKTVEAISQTREIRDFFNRYADPRPYANERAAQLAAEEFHGQSGVKLDTVQYNGEYRNVPHAAMKELKRQWDVDNPGALGKALTLPNKLFRNTVLPFSPRLPVMHDVEAISRLMLLEKGNLPRVLPDYLRGRAMLRAHPDNVRAALEQLTTPGGLSHSASGAVGEDIGQTPAELEGAGAPLRLAAKRVGNVFSGLSTQIIRFQRMLEKPSQVAALGAHGRVMLQEWGHSWLDANTNITRYTEELSKGIAQPDEAVRAAESMHRAMGQYNAFTASQRYALRVVPFGSWYVNAAKLIFDVLPRDHPLFSALLQDVALVNSKKWAAQHAGVYSDLQTAMKVGPAAWLDVGKLTPVGLQEPLLTTASQLVLPQYAGALHALAGQDPFGSELTNATTKFASSAAPGGIFSGKPGAGTAALQAIEQLVESMGGPLNLAAKIAYNRGGTFYNTDTPDLHLLTGGGIGSTAIKPGSTKQQKGFLNLPGSLDKALDPFHPTTIPKTKPKATSGTSLGSPTSLGKAVKLG